MNTHLLLVILVVVAFGASPPVVSPVQALMLARLVTGMYTTGSRWLGPITMLFCGLYTITARVGHSTKHNEHASGIIRAGALAFTATDTALLVMHIVHNETPTAGTILSVLATYAAAAFAIRRRS